MIDWVSIGIGAVIAVAVTLLGVYVSPLIGGRRVRVRFTHLATSVIAKVTDRPHSGHLEVRFDGQPVPLVTESTIVLWNAGHSRILPSDIAPSAPLAVRFQSDVRVLSHGILLVTDSDIRARLERDDTHGGYIVAFDYLPPRDGIAMQFLHTGAGLDAVTIAGKFTDGGEPEWGSPWRNWVLSAAALGGLALFLLGDAILSPPRPAPLWEGILLSAPLLAWIALLLAAGRRKTTWLFFSPELRLAPFVPPYTAPTRDGRFGVGGK